MTPELKACIEVFRKWLHLPDPAHVLVAMATVAANRGKGDPVWTLLVGGPSSGKTEAIMAFTDEPDVHLAAIITEGGLLSATPAREKKKDSSGGLLREIGEFGILALKDFTTVLAMNTDTRAQLLAALREIYDGSWTRHVGTDGGRKLHWKGKIGMVAGVTSAIDAHYAVMAALGDRFLLCRLPDPDEQEQSDSALEHLDEEEEMRYELAAAVNLALGNVDPDRLVQKLQPEQRSRLGALAALAVRCRSAVIREPYKNEIVLIPAREGPARLVKVLLRILNGLQAIGQDETDSWELVAKLALDCIPPIRLACLRRLIAGKDLTTSALADKLGYPTNTVRRALEDLTVHGVATRTSPGQGKADLWNESEWTHEQWWATLPEKPPEAGKGSKKEATDDDASHSPTGFSGKVQPEEPEPNGQVVAVHKVDDGGHIAYRMYRPPGEPLCCLGPWLTFDLAAEHARGHGWEAVQR